MFIKEHSHHNCVLGGILLYLLYSVPGYDNTKTVFTSWIKLKQIVILSVLSLCSDTNCRLPALCRAKKGAKLAQLVIEIFRAKQFILKFEIFEKYSAVAGGSRDNRLQWVSLGLVGSSSQCHNKVTSSQALGLPPLPPPPPRLYVQEFYC